MEAAMIGFVLAIGAVWGPLSAGEAPTGWSRVAATYRGTDWEFGTQIPVWMYEMDWKPHYKNHGYQIQRPVGEPMNAPIFLGGACVRFAPVVSNHFRWSAPDVAQKLSVLEGTLGVPVPPLRLPPEVHWTEYYKSCGYGWQPTREEVKSLP